ncbi:LCP family protein [Nostocoides sp. HKS02]|uniref:LCP family protein n=1 Tax=Nostocoides sp. HKS02 TaxID=1813880 RepID=UPI0012B48329|nr:LCP family protein [Tetrasphaera sp. HKS02]QGN56655.1 transcriptional regulator [Tetrasphaera sp. HKS02]
MTTPEDWDAGSASSDDEVYTVDTRSRTLGTGRAGRATRATRAGVAATAAGGARTADRRRGGPLSGAGPAQPGAYGGAQARPEPRVRRPRRRGRLVVAVVALLVLAWLAFMIWVPFDAWGQVARVDTTPAAQQPPQGKGHDYLLVGSDSRAGLTAQQKKELTTGSADGQRTDSIILVHVPAGGGKPALISIPRDSYVPIPGHHSNKINAAYAIGGPKLLVETLQNAMGIRLDGYVEIGFGGFAGVVDSLGGVDICVPFHMNDPHAGINLKKGCQTLNGKNALGYVRARYSDPRGDIGRAERQRQFLAAIMKKAATPSTVLVPTEYYGFTHAASTGLTVGQDTTMWDVLRVLQAMRAISNGQGLSLVVPIQSVNYQTSAGSSVKWDTARAKALFTLLREDQPLEAPPAGTDGKPSQG